MTTRIITAAIAAIALSVTAVAEAVELNDTIYRIADVDSMVIINYPESGLMRISVRSADRQMSITRPIPDKAVITSGEPDCEFPGRLSYSLTQNRDGSPDVSISSGGLSFGFVTAMGMPGGMNVDMAKSFEIGIDQIVGFDIGISRYASLSLGFGVRWRNYRNTSVDGMFEYADGHVGWQPFPADVSGHYSRIKVFSLNIPLLYRQKMPFRLFGSRQWLAAGITGNYATHASLRTVWTNSDGKRMTVKNNKIGHRRFSYDIVAMIGIDSSTSLYVRYSPLSPLRGIGQPVFHTLSTGVSIGF